MPGKLDKPHRIRVRALDGKLRESNKLKGQLVPHVDVLDAKDKVEFIICAVKEAHLEQVRAKLAGAGLEEMAGGNTTVAVTVAPKPALSPQHRPGGSQHRGGPPQRGGAHQQQGRQVPAPTNAQSLPGKPYGFVALPRVLTAAAPVWHDGARSEGRLSGEIRLEFEALTPLLVGWERGQVGEDRDESWPIPAILDGVGTLADKKSVLCPLRAPWGSRPVLIPGDSLKGLLRHELGALLGAPMERVAERSYSYRPNAKFPDSQNGRVLEPRLARVRAMATIDVAGRAWPAPEVLDVLMMATRDQQSYFPRRERSRPGIVRPTREAEPYKGGMGGGQALPSAVLSEDARRKLIHTHIDVGTLHVDHASARPSQTVVAQYGQTLAHLLDTDAGHFGARHPEVGSDAKKQRLGSDAVRKAADSAFQPGDLIWVEWDTDKKCIVSLGWHYYYRWAYTDSVRRRGGRYERHGLFPLDEERVRDGGGAPSALSPVRRLFGYTGDNEGSEGIGEGDHAQLMGRVSVNAAIEVVAAGEADDQRFLAPTFLKELGMPRPSAVEHYVQQLQPRRERPSDKATLATYGDATGYDTPGELAGRKFYLDRREAHETDETKRTKLWTDDSADNQGNERSTLALDASQPGRRFRFTIRFGDLDPTELAAIVTALCPHQFRDVLAGKHGDGYCSKLGYARPLGWGTVRVEARSLLLLATASDAPALNAVQDLVGWVRANHQPTAAQPEWLAVHRHKHPDAADYPTKDGQIYTFHTSLRAEHTRWRRYRRERSP